MNPYILAEIASAHLGSVIDCMAMIQQAQKAGADGVKIQIWEESEISQHPAFENLRKYELSRNEWQEIAETTDILEVDLWIEVIGFNSLKFAKTLKPYAWKIPHHIAVNTPLLEGETVFHRVQTQGADVVNVAIGEQHYPTSLDIARKEIELVKYYNARGSNILYAEHQQAEGARNPGYTALLAYHAGANVIEKHICLSRKDLKPHSQDHISALEPDEFRKFVEFMKKYERGGKVRMLV